MDFQKFIENVQELEFIKNRETADATTKAVIGVLASRLKEEPARRMCEELPDPLTYDKLRGEQVTITGVSVPEFYRTIRTQFHISEEQAERLVKVVLKTAMEAVSNTTGDQIKKSLPPEWRALIEQAESISIGASR